MMKLLLPFLLLFTLSALAQDERPAPPIDDATGKIIYTEVVALDSARTSADLYSSAREWFAKAYKSSNNVLQMDDREGGRIVGKALMQVYHRALGRDFPSGYINYTISVYVKDGRYKYEVTDFHHTGQLLSSGGSIPDMGPCEDFLYPKKKRAKKTYDYYLEQMDLNTRALILSLRESMNTQTASLESEDW